MSIKPKSEKQTIDIRVKNIVKFESKGVRVTICDDPYNDMDKFIVKANSKPKK